MVGLIRTNANLSLSLAVLWKNSIKNTEAYKQMWLVIWGGGTFIPTNSKHLITSAFQPARVAHPGWATVPLSLSFICILNILCFVLPIGLISPDFCLINMLIFCKICWGHKILISGQKPLAGLHIYDVQILIISINWHINRFF